MADGRKYNIQVKAQTDLGDLVKLLKETTNGLKSTVTNTALFASKAVVLKKALDELVEIMISATNSAIAFNKALANVGTLIPQQTARLNELKNGILKLSSETGKPLDDLTNGLYEVISAFEDSADTMGRLEAVTKASMAGQATTIDALQLLSAVGKGFNDTSADMLNYIADLSFETIRLGQTNFPQLAHAIQIVTANSYRLGVSMEEMFNVFATMTGVTGNADIVATQLRSALASLADPTEDMAKAFSHFGYESGEAMVSALGFGGAVKALVEYADEAGTTVEKLFQRVEAVNLVTSLSTVQWDTYNRKLSEMQDASGASALALAEVTNGINKTGFEIEQIQRNVDSLIQKFGQGILESVSGVITEFNDLTYTLNGGNVGLQRMKRSTNDLVMVTSEYKQIVEMLELAIKSENEEEAKLLATRKELTRSKVMDKVLEVKDSYSSFTRELEKNNSTIESNKSEMEILGKTLKDVATNAGIDTSVEGWTGTLENYATSASLGYEANVKFRESCASLGLSFTEVTDYIEAYNHFLEENYALTAENQASNEDMEDNIKTLAYLYNQGTLSLADFAFYQEELKQRILDTSEELKKQGDIVKENSTTTFGRTTVSKEQKIGLLEIRATTAGMGTNEITKLASEFVLNLEKLKQKQEEYNFLYANTPEIAKLFNDALEKQIEALEQQYLVEYEEIKTREQYFTEDLQYQLDSLKNNDELFNLERERTLALREIVGTENDSAKNQQLINDYYDEQARQLKEQTAEKEKQERLDREAQQRAKEATIRQIEFEIADASGLTNYQRQVQETNLEIADLEDQIADLNAEIELNPEFKTENEKIIKNLREQIKLLKKEIAGLDEGDMNYQEWADGFVDKFDDIVGKIQDVYSPMKDAINSIFETIWSFEDQDIAKKEEHLKQLEDAYDKEKDLLDDRKSEQMDALQEAYEADTISYEEYLARKNEVDNKYNEDLKKAGEEKDKIEKELAKKEYQRTLQQFYTDKAMAIADVAISTALGSAKALEWGFPMGQIFAGIIGALGAVQAGAIIAQQPPAPPAFAEGGIVTKPTMGLIAEAGYNEAVIPLEKNRLKKYGLLDDNEGTSVVYQITGNNFVGVGGVDELIVMLDERTKVLKKRGVI